MMDGNLLTNVPILPAKEFKTPWSQEYFDQNFRAITYEASSRSSVRCCWHRGPPWSSLG